MAGAIRHARWINAVEAMVQTMFNDFWAVDSEGTQKIASLQKACRPLLRFASQQFKLLKEDVTYWRQKVTSGELDFDPAREEDFKVTLRAFVEVSNLISEKLESFRKKNTYLAIPRFVIQLQECNQEAQKLLDSWQSPEWEVTGARTVKWDKDQTDYLLAKLGSCK